MTVLHFNISDEVAAYEAKKEDLESKGQKMYTHFSFSLYSYFLERDIYNSI